MASFFYGLRFHYIYFKVIYNKYLIHLNYKKNKIDNLWESAKIYVIHYKILTIITVYILNIWFGGGIDLLLSKIIAVWGLVKDDKKR